jgi:negative regulator of replication initiation
MTTLEVKLNLPDRLAREAQAAGLLTPKALSRLLKDAMQRRAAQQLLAGAKRATDSGSKPLCTKEIQASVKAVRQTRRASIGPTKIRHLDSGATTSSRI